MSKTLTLSLLYHAKEILFALSVNSPFSFVLYIVICHSHSTQWESALLSYLCECCDWFFGAVRDSSSGEREGHKSLCGQWERKKLKNFRRQSNCP